MKTAIVLMMGLSMAAVAQPRGGRVYLGEAHVDGAADHDRIVVTGARGEYRALQLRVENAAINFDRVVVHFGNGTSERLTIRRRIPAGQETRIIDLPGQRNTFFAVCCVMVLPPISFLLFEFFS